MIRLLAAPEVENFAPEILSGLNRAFGHWGNADQFNWAFRRQREDPSADLFVAEDVGKLVAGIALVYRRVSHGSGPSRLIGCLSGAWTIPEHRTQGLFGELVRAAVARSLERAAAATIAFAAGGRASSATLARMNVSSADGAVFEVAAGWAGALSGPCERHELAHAVTTFAERTRPAGSITMSHDAASWQRQMLDRPRPVEVLRLADGTLVAVERSAAAMTILDVSTDEPLLIARTFRTLACLARASGLSLAATAFDPATIALLDQAGVGRRTIRLHILAAERDLADAAQWRIANGDRM